MDDRRCDVISMVDASDCRGGVAVSMCNLGAVAAEKVIRGQELYSDPAHHIISSCYRD